MSLEIKQLYEFDDFCLDVSEKVLTRAGKPVSLTPKVFDTLRVLTENAGHLVEKDELMKKIWQDRYVEDSNLTFNIKMLRKALGDRASAPHFIETVPRRGYRFIAEVRKNPVPEPPASEEEPKKPLTNIPPPFLLIAISVILLFSLAFVWLRKQKTATVVEMPKRITQSGKVTVAVVSPNGKSLVFAQKEGAGESLWRRELTTGSQTQILPPAAVEYVGLNVAPAGDFIYYSIFAKNSAVLTLSRVPLEGGAPEPLPEIATDVSISFSPDGQRFAYTESVSSFKETLLKTARADGTDQRTLLNLKGEKRVLPIFRASPLAWSPDGNEIACAVQEIDENGVFYRILLIDVRDGSEKYLSAERWNLVESIAWKDADNLAIIDHEPNSPGRQIRLVSRHTGKSRALGQNSKKYEWLSAANGKLFAVEQNTHSSLFVADLAGDLKAAQTKQIFNEPGAIENIDWSKREKIFYNSWASGKNEVWRINPDGTMPEQLTEDSNLTHGFAVSPADEKIVFSALAKGASSLFTADSNGHGVRQLTSGVNDSLPRFMPDGKEVVFQQGSLVKPTLWRVRLDRRQMPEQLTGYFAQQPSVSPDGKTIAYQFMDYSNGNQVWRLALMDSRDGKLLNKIDFPFSITERKIVWHPRGNFLTMVYKKDADLGFLLLSPESGAVQMIENISRDKISSFAWSPDGKRLAFTENHETRDVVVIDDFEG